MLFTPCYNSPRLSSHTHLHSLQYTPKCMWGNFVVSAQNCLASGHVRLHRYSLVIISSNRICFLGAVYIKAFSKMPQFFHWKRIKRTTVFATFFRPRFNARKCWLLWENTHLHLRMGIWCKWNYRMPRALFALSKPIRRGAVLECLHFRQLLKVYAFPLVPTVHDVQNTSRTMLSETKNASAYTGPEDKRK